MEVSRGGGRLCHAHHVQHGIEAAKAPPLAIFSILKILDPPQPPPPIAPPLSGINSNKCAPYSQAASQPACLSVRVGSVNEPAEDTR